MQGQLVLLPEQSANAEDTAVACCVKGGGEWCEEWDWNHASRATEKEGR